MDVQKKKVVRSIIIIWLVSLVVCCVSAAAVAQPESGDTPVSVMFLIPVVDGILLGILLAKQLKGKRKIVLFSILFAISFALGIGLTAAVYGTVAADLRVVGLGGIVRGLRGGLLAVFGNATMLGGLAAFAAIWAIEGILFGLLSSLITNKVCKQK